MKVIDVNKQVRLSLVKTVELVFSGVKFRLFRAMVTVVIISLAVAFLMTMLSQSVIARKVASAIEEQTAPRRLFVFWVSRLTQPMQPAELAAELASTPPGGDRWRELKAWGGLDDEQMNFLAETARRQLELDGYFAGLEEGYRRAMLGRTRGEQIYTHLADPEAFETFKQARSASGRELPGGIEALQSFIAKWPEIAELRGRISSEHAAAAEQFRKDVLGETSPHLYLSKADESLLAETAAMGFRMTTEELAVVREQAGLAVDAERIAGMIQAPSVRNALRARLKKESATDVGRQELFGLLKSGNDTEWFLGELGRIRDRITEQVDTPGVRERENISQEEIDLLVASRQPVFAFDLPPERITEVAREGLRAIELNVIESKVSQAAGGGGVLGFSSRTIAIICVSFLVCMVGVVNAMLMSVAERFREIATMKCLGATDGFIMVNFVLESAVQGVAGGVVGSVLGIILGTFLSWTAYGGMAVAHLPIGDMLAAAGISFMLGVVLSVLAAVYPALTAARLAPMEAMRIE